jgi:hypothetical protein
MGVGDIVKHLISTVSKLGTLEVRTADVAKTQDRIEAKLETFVERLAKIETSFEYLKTNVKNEIITEVKVDVMKSQLLLNHYSKESQCGQLFEGTSISTTPKRSIEQKEKEESFSI